MKRLIAMSALALLAGVPYAAHARDGAVLVAATATTTSAPECARSANPSFVQRQILEKAAQGVRPLVLYIQRTRMIHQLDVMETIAWLDQRRACGAQVAGRA
jgi:hypothetical protein